jgi:hypothetical protein
MYHASGIVGIGFMAYRRKSKPALMAAQSNDDQGIEKPPPGGFSFFTERTCAARLATLGGQARMVFLERF